MRQRGNEISVAHYLAASLSRGEKLMGFTAAQPILPLIAMLAVLFAMPVWAENRQPGRSGEVEREFQRLHPCPSTGQLTGPCPGYVKDHINPLACGGPDAVSNMQWQTTEQAKAKDKVERRGCANRSRSRSEISGGVTILRGW